MKRHYFISVLIILGITSILNGQDSKRDSNPWSISFSYSPKLEISRYLQYSGGQPFYKSFNNMIDYRLRRHLSLSFGINVNFEKEDYSNSDYNGISYDFRTFSEKIVLFEFPVQLNYHFRDTSKFFNPYIKLGLRNSFYHRDFVILPENLSYPYTRYFLLMDLGLGSYLKVSNHLSLIYEASVGFGLKYLRSDYVYLEGLIGLRYTLK
jgi:hypothetical protein